MKPVEKGIWLEVGCGTKPKRTKGTCHIPVKPFMRNDIQALLGIDYVCPSWEIDQHIEHGIVEFVYSRHFFEHLTRKEASATLKAWWNVLKPGGRLVMVVPDIRFHIKQFLHPNRDSVALSNMPDLSLEEHAIAGFWGFQENEWMIHKSGYDFPLLKKTLEQHGFKKVDRINDLAKHLSVECVK